MLILALIAAAAAPGDSKTISGVDVWPWMTIDGVGLDSGGPIYMKARSSGDLDGDGRPDTVIIRMDCAAGVMHTAQYQVVSPRDAASGQTSGKRMHKPFKIVKEWGAATPQLRAMKTGYDVKKVEGTGARAKTMMEDSWHSITLANSEELCAAAATAKVTKTRSNIQNN